MKQYIDKEAVAAEIKKRFDEYSSSILKHYDACKEAKAQELGKILTILDTLETKEVDLEKEYKDFVEEDPVYNKLINNIVGKAIAKHFFELGIQSSNLTTVADRGMAEEIIVNLKRVEQDYCIDLTSEMEWLRNIVKKGE